jgi:hypothetical protein
MKLLQNIKSACLWVFLLPTGLAFSQSTYLMPGTKHDWALTRLEIKARTPQLSFSHVRPISIRQAVTDVEMIDSLIRAQNAIGKTFSSLDKYNMVRFLMAYTDWSKSREVFKSEKPILKSFWKNRANLFEVNDKDFYIAVNPVIYYEQKWEKGNTGQNLFLNTRGIQIRGNIGKRVGFYMHLTDNQERQPLYVQHWRDSTGAVPGVGAYKPFKAKGGVDYFDNRAGIMVNVAKYIDISFGFDKNFIGSGHRSLVLSDFSNNALFLKINTRVWKLNYENLFMELVPFNPKFISNKLLPKKYFRSNHLSYQVNRWLNIGIFDAVMFGRKDHFEFSYLLPVLFLRPMEINNGSPDNALVGLDVKANVAGKAQLYGQLMLDEFKLSELRSGNQWWANKFGYQLGIKYLDVAGIQNLDVQVETNRVRPFTYTHFDSVSNYTHFNQPFAHPLGANFQEYITIIRYQATKRLFLRAQFNYYFQGRDSLGLNFGGNVGRSYFDNRPGDYGFEVGSGNRSTNLYAHLLASYELKENMFIDFSYTQRNYKEENGYKLNSTIFSAAFRWNIGRRDFDW